MSEYTMKNLKAKYGVAQRIEGEPECHVLLIFTNHLAELYN